MTFENGKISSWTDDKGFGFITPNRVERPSLSTLMTSVKNINVQGKDCLSIINYQPILKVEDVRLMSIQKKGTRK